MNDESTKIVQPYLLWSSDDMQSGDFYLDEFPSVQQIRVAAHRPYMISHPAVHACRVLAKHAPFVRQRLLHRSHHFSLLQFTQNEMSFKKLSQY